MVADEQSQVGARKLLLLLCASPTGTFLWPLCPLSFPPTVCSRPARSATALLPWWHVLPTCNTQVITLSDDHVVRLWDLRNHKCVQTIGSTGERRRWARVDCRRRVCTCRGRRHCWQPAMEHCVALLSPCLACAAKPLADWLRPEDSRPTALCHDSRRRRLVW